MAGWRQYQPSAEIRKWVPVLENILRSAGIPVYEGLPKAVNALSKVAGYYGSIEIHDPFISGRDAQIRRRTGLARTIHGCRKS